jgi:hypothetical protein
MTRASQNKTKQNKIYYGVRSQAIDNMFRPFPIRLSTGQTWCTKQVITMLQSTYMHSTL